MPTDTLTDAKCRAAKPAEKDYKLFDGGGLYLFVTAKGAKVWRLAYRIRVGDALKPKTISFGPYPEVTLSEARRRRDEARAALRDGGDPMAPRRARASITLREGAHAYRSGRKDVTDAYRQNALRCLETHIFPTTGDKAMGTVTRADLLVPLNKMDEAGLHDYVRKARLWLAQVFDWGMEQEHCEGNPAKLIDPEKAFAKKKTEHFAAVEPREVGELLDRIKMEDKHLQAVLACWFLAYTWVRTVECRMMLWEELHDDDTLWIIPAGKMKRSRDHVIPLPRQAREIIRTMRARSRGSRFVWPGDRSLDRPMSENAVLALLYRIGYQGRMTGHGWRSTASTWANEAGWNPDAVEMQLAHVEDNKTRSAYNRSRYIEERRQMLQTWADWLDAQGQAAQPRVAA